MKKTAQCLTLLGAAAATGAVYSHFIEPNMLRRRNFSVGNGENGKIVRIVHFTDVHLGRFYSIRKFNRLVADIKKLNPDIVVFTGDLIDNPTEYPVDTERVSRILKRIKAPLGKYAVTGNHEVRHAYVNKYESILKKGGFRLLRDDSVYLPEYNINIVGCESSTMENKKNTQRLIPLGRKNFSHIECCDKLMSIGAFNILLTHEPDTVDELTNRCCDLVFAGHSHGGQIRCPIIEKMYIPPLARKYTRGLNTTYDGCLVHTCEGVGMTRFPFRFCCPPTIGVADIKL